MSFTDHLFDGDEPEDFYDEEDDDRTEDDIYNDECANIGHDDETVYEDDTGYDWRCRRCGAEGWVEYDDV